MKTILTGGILVGLLTTVAIGEDRRPQAGERQRPIRPGQGGPDEMFERMDRDGDGKISKREFIASPRISQLPEEKREAIFTRLDRDDDGFLTPREIRGMRHDAERRVREGFRKLDTDGSGGLSYEEFARGEFAAKLPEEKRRQIFDRMDTDGDGEITAADKPKGPPERPDRRSEGRSEGRKKSGE